MQRGFVARGEQSGRLDYHLHAEFAPRQLGGVAFGEHLQRLAVEKNAAAFRFDFVAQRAVNRIVLEQMREGGRVGNVVDGDDFDVLFGQRRAQEHPADPAESVNPDFYRHRSNPPTALWKSARTLDKFARDVQILR